jgi:ATP-dependent Clp endopeptidase proteolytic subunit ClpP
MELKYIQNLSKDSADIYLYDEIGYGVNAQGFVNELNYLSNSLEIPVINVRINSPGGSVIDGMGIFAAIQNSKAEVNTYIDGIAASAAGFIAMAGKKRYMAAHALLVMHNVSGGYSDDPEEQVRINNAINAMETSIATILSNNSGLSLEDVKLKMNQETWINANDALELKFVDSVFNNTPKKRMAKNELYDLVNSIVKPNINKMNKVLNYFNLDETATEEAVIEKIDAIKTESQNEVDVLKAEKEALENELNVLKAEKTAKEEAEKEVLAVAEVENAINAGKFDAAKKEELVNTAKNDLEGFKNLVLSIKTAVAPDITNLMNKGKSGKQDDNRETWNILDWQKKDPNGLKNIMDNEPETYKRLYNEHYRPDLKNN